MEKLQKLIENNPDDPFPCYGLAMELRGLNLASKAAGVFSELLQRRPNYVAAYLQYAVCGRPDRSGGRRQGTPCLEQGDGSQLKRRGSARLRGASGRTSSVILKPGA